MNNTNNKSTLKRLISYITLHKGRVLSGLICSTLIGFADAVYAPILGWIIDGFSKIGTNLADSGQVIAEIEILVFKKSFGSINITSMEEASSALFTVGGLIVILILIKGVFIYGREYLMASVVQKVVKKFRDQLYSNLLKMKVSYFDQGKTGEIMSKLTNDIQVIEVSLISFVNLSTAFLHTIIFVSALIYLDWKLSLFAVMVFPISGFVIRLFSKAIRKISNSILEKIADINAFLQESLTSIKIVKVYNREEYEANRFKNKTYQNYSYSMKANRLVAFLKPLNEIFSTLGLVGVVLYSGFRIMNGEMDIADFTMFIMLVTLAYKPIKTLTDAQPVIQKALASADRVFDLLDTENELNAQNFKEYKSYGQEGKVVFKDVEFSYNNEDKVIKKMNFEVKPGETIAFVGQSGAGKSTIINLLLKFYNYDSGSIKINGNELKDLSPNIVRDMMSLVPQETFLFSGTVKDNIRYGYLESSDEEIFEASKAANAHNFILELPNGYDTEIGERGVQISGGQRQRLAIARAILKKPMFLLLDEATSSLDSESEALVQEATQKIMKDRTAFVIAHRLSTLR